MNLRTANIPAQQAIKAANNWARSTDFTGSDQREYRIGYRSLCQLFDNYVRVDNYKTVVAGATSVYGWMPTIAKGVDFTQWERCADNLRLLKTSDSWMNVKQIIQKTPDILRLISGSVVGTSKFMHFLNPNVIPIWDSNIGRVFGANYHSAVDNEQRYLRYGDELAAAILSPIDYPERFMEFSGQDISKVRQLEQLLFLYGQHLGQTNKMKASNKIDN